MSTIAVYRNVRFVIFSRDHRPPHIHAIAPDAEVVIHLETLEVIRVHGFTTQAVTQIQQFIEQRNEEFLEAWYEIHKK